jgi:Flp pilus assembly protein TadG
MSALKRKRGMSRGQAVVEAAFALPFLIFLMVGAFDWGFFSYALIVTEDAARGAALYTATSSTTANDSAGACNYVLANFRSVPNITTTVITCSQSPLVVTATAVTAPDGNPASVVTVTYTCMQMIPIPGLLMGKPTISRTVEMRVRS